MTVACYLRVSTGRQKHDGQQAEIQQWLDRNGVVPAQVEWYADKESGSTLDRPEFDRLQRDIFEGKTKAVVLWKLDRLSRRLKDGVNILASWCEKDIKIVVVTQQIELNGAVGRTIAALLLGLAEIENEYRRQRQMAGIAAAKTKGTYTGRKRGTTKTQPERAKELRDKGLTAAEIAQALGVSQRTAFRYLGLPARQIENRQRGDSVGPTSATIE